MQLTGQVALVTGGARGIGREIALLLAREGADCALFDVNEPVLAQTCQEIEALGRRALGLRVDVTDAANVDDAVGKVLDKLGRIDILLNNAGITQDGLLIRMDDAQWDRVLAINLKGAFLCTRAVAKAMSVEKAVEELKRCKGTQFDPMVVDAMIELFNEGRLLPHHDPHQTPPPTAPPDPTQTPHVHTY